MCKEATKAADNMYYKARIKASEFDERFRGRIGASEQLHVNPTTLAKYELETLSVSNDMALLMSEIYNAPELLNWYCCNECSIGKHNKQEIELKDIELVTLQLIKKLHLIEEHKNKLIDIAADGIIDEAERPIMDEVLNYFSEIRQTVDELDLWFKKNTKEKARLAADNIKSQNKHITKIS